MGGDPVNFIDPSGKAACLIIPLVEGLLVLITAYTAYDVADTIIEEINSSPDLVLQDPLDNLIFNKGNGDLPESVPSTDPDDWEKIKGSKGAYRPKGGKEPVFEKDRAGDRSHGGSKWKKWNKGRDWKNKKQKSGTYNEDGVRLRD